MHHQQLIASTKSTEMHDQLEQCSHADAKPSGKQDKDYEIKNRKIIGGKEVACMRLTSMEKESQKKY